MKHLIDRAETLCGKPLKDFSPRNIRFGFFETIGSGGPCPQCIHNLGITISNDKQYTWELEKALEEFKNTKVPKPSTPKPAKVTKNQIEGRNKNELH